VETLLAPPSWRCIDFISDIHLHDGLPRTTATLEAYLRSTTADAVFILGDLFEAWVGDDMRTQAYEAHCTGILAHCGQRLALHVMVGNRDFLLGQDMLSSIHAQGLQDPTILTAFGQRLLLTHGDALCLQDQAYLAFRQQVRTTDWQRTFLNHPLEARLAQARQMRAASQMHQQAQKPETWADVDEAAAGRWMAAANTPVLVHGHTHRPTEEPFGVPGGVRHVLADWDVDQHPGRGDILRLSAQGFSRIPLPQLA
jgi:UDP-2,3-diacylglucosamine hydrolase